MLPQADTLHTIAEVGIAVTGFAGIVAAVRSRATSRPQPTDPLRMLLVSSLGSVLFCFVPEWLSSAIAAPDAIWRLSLGLFGIYRLVYGGLIIRRVLGAAASYQHRWLGVVSLVIAVLHLVAAFGLLARFQYFLYLSGLLWGIVVALVHFADLLLLSPPPDSRAV